MTVISKCQKHVCSVPHKFNEKELDKFINTLELIPFNLQVVHNKLIFETPHFESLIEILNAFVNTHASLHPDSTVDLQELLDLIILA